MTHLRVGETIRIQLSSNPTTGYSWNYTIKGNNQAITVHSKYEPGYPMLEGSGGNDIFYITGNKPGRCSLVLTYSRPWETIPPEQVEMYRFIVY